jgi:hypothetical protein
MEQLSLESGMGPKDVERRSQVSDKEADTARSALENAPIAPLGGRSVIPGEAGNDFLV